MSDNIQDKIFAIVVDGDVAATLHISPSAPNYDRLVAGLSSDPIVRDATHVPNVRYGWSFDGVDFNEPVE